MFLMIGAFKSSTNYVKANKKKEGNGLGYISANIYSNKNS